MVLDSTVLIDHFADIPPATRFIRGLGARGCVTAITRAEVLVGTLPADRARYIMLMDRLRWLELSVLITDRAADLRRAHGWKLPDAFQAAFALHHGLKLATRNTRDFPPETHAFVEVPYTL